MAAQHPKRDPQCVGKKCLKFINPEQYPDATFGIPYKFDLTYGACVDCQHSSGSAPQKEAPAPRLRRPTF